VLAQVSPYAGQETREIKALSAQEVDDLLNARGWRWQRLPSLMAIPDHYTRSKWLTSLVWVLISSAQSRTLKRG
jgi:hypothetical protein